jgi:hypothetical protein
MIKNLRYSFVALLMMLFSGVSARDVVIVPSDFTATESADYELIKDGIMVAVTASTVTDSQIRVFKGQSIAIAGVTGNISKIVFTCTAEGTTKYGPGCFGATEGYTYEGSVGTWTGTSKYVLFTAESAQVRITQIVVTTDGEGGTTPDDNPGNEDSIFSKFDFTKGSFTENDTQLIFEFEGQGDSGTENVKIPVTGKFVFDIENKICTSCTAYLTFPNELYAQAALISVQASAEKDGYTDVQLDGTTLSLKSTKEFIGVSKIVIKSMLKMLLDDEQGGYGILANPLSPNLANILAGTLDNKEVTDEEYFIKGKIASIEEPFGAQFGNATFFISLDGNTDFTFYVYRALYLENQKWAEGNTQIKVGDEVIVCGKLTNYNGTPETAQGKAYIYSLNGVTKNEGGGETPDPQIKSLTIAAALDIINGLEDGKTTAEEYEVKGFVVGTPDFQRKADGSLYGNVNFAIADEKGGATTLTVFRAKDFENASFTEETINRIKEGDEVVVRGKLQKYVKNGEMTPELTNCYLISVTSAAAEGAKVWDFTQWSAATVANLKADAAASKTSGWSDVEKKADAEAGADPTEASKDNCFWLQLEAAPADGALTANGVVIEELKGLLFTEDATATSRNIAIAVNYSVADASKDFGPYAGGSYLWVGGKDRKFTIPNVAAGSTITMEVESHKITDGRGVKLMQDGNQIGDAFTPKAKESHSWTIENSGDVVVANTNGCHIYKIEIAAGETAIKAVKTAKADNGYIYNLAGQRVDANYKGVVIKNGQKMIQK